VTKGRIATISTAVVIALALFGGFVWPGVFNNSTPTTNSASATSQAAPQPSIDSEKQQEEANRRVKEQQFAAIIAEDGSFYNCPENAAAKAARDVDQLVPCGTETVEVTKKGNTASDVPMIVTAGEGGNNVVATTFGPVFIPEDGTTRPMWTVSWTVGENSTLLQMYALYNCRSKSGLCWAPRYKPQGTYSVELDDTIVKLAFVFTDGKPGFPVPGEWWSKETGLQNNRQY
jgi:hypothetical protein